jgi:hypothetical protein
MVTTDKFIRILLNKEYGLLPPGGTLSHVAVIQMQNYHKLLFVSDVAIIPYPDLAQKITMTGVPHSYGKGSGDRYTQSCPDRRHRAGFAGYSSLYRCCSNCKNG